ncbi:hypothetical protein BU029_12615 [Staphylococcus simulans]|nr:hypothetical protein BU029_12615 [Staphylococcus simulans]
MFISEIVHISYSFLLKLYYKINFATEPISDCIINIICDLSSNFFIFSPFFFVFLKLEKRVSSCFDLWSFRLFFD